jgi:hypothetical protein
MRACSNKIRRVIQQKMRWPMRLFFQHRYFSMEIRLCLTSRLIVRQSLTSVICASRAGSRCLEFMLKGLDIPILNSV